MKTYTHLSRTTGLMTALLALLLFPAFSNAATFTAIASGSWSSSATWAGGVAPGSTLSAGDEVVIGSSFNVTANSDILIDGLLASLDVNGMLDAGSNTLTVVNGTVSGTGNIVVDQISVGLTGLLTFAGSIDAQTFVNNGATLTLVAAANVQNQLQLNGGAIVLGSLTNALTLASGSQIVMNGGTLSLSGGLFTATQAYTVLYNGTSAVAGLELSGSGLTGVEVDLDSPSSNVTLMGNVIVDGDVTLSQGTLVLGNNSLSVNGLVDATANGSIDASIGSTLNVSTSGSGTIDLSFASSPEVIGTLSINPGSNASISLNGDLEVATAFSLSSGTFNLHGNSLSVMGDFNAAGQFETGAGASFSLSGNGTVQGGFSVAGGSQPMADLTIDLTGGQSIHFDGEAVVSGSFNFQNGTIDLQSGSSLTLDGSASFGASAMFDGDADADLHIGTSGNVTGDLAFASGASTIGDLTVGIGGNGSVSLGSDLAVEGDLSLSSGMLVVGGNTLMINGDLAAVGSGSISVSGSSNIEIHADGDLSSFLTFTAGSSTMGDLVIDIDNGGSVTLGTDAEVSGTLDLQNGFITVGNSDLTVSGNITGASANSYVVTWGAGSLMLDLTAGADAFFPVGTDMNYAPATLLQAAGSANGMFGVSVANDVYAAGNAGIDMSTWGSMVDHTWNVTSDASSNIDLTLTLEWDASAQVNAFDHTDAYISHYVNAAWDVSAHASATVNGQGRYELSRSGITSLSPFAVFDGASSVGIDEKEALSISFYPNPVVDMVTYDLQGQNGNTNVDLFDVSGKLVASQIAQSTKGTMDVSELPSGIYTVRITNDNSVTTARMIKQ